MAYVIKDVSNYRFWNKDGTVVDPVTDEPKRFPTKEAAQSYASLSHFSGHQIVSAR